MGVKLIASSNKSFTTVGELKNGQIAIVTSDSHYGTVVQRYGDSCVAIGKSSGHGWSSCKDNTLQVRILKDGELIEVFNNDEKTIC